MKFNAFKNSRVLLGRDSGAEEKPNPSTGTFYLSFYKPIKNIKIYVTNSLGVHVVENEVFDVEEVVLNLNDVASGIYILRLDIGDSSEFVKLIRN
ncbi:MAG: T9SS type A sorting domain-containing protein [Cytophagaceae bacterium]